jgi:hypothetical protein
MWSRTRKKMSILSRNPACLPTVRFSPDFGDHQQYKSRQHMQEKHSGHTAERRGTALGCRIPKHLLARMLPHQLHHAVSVLSPRHRVTRSCAAVVHLQSLASSEKQNKSSLGNVKTRTSSLCRTSCFCLHSQVVWHEFTRNAVA